MFPFNLPGPQFIAFYLGFFVVVLVVLRLARRHYESGPPPPIGPKDPYLLACLRGGPEEVACIATLGLIDRDLLQITDRTVTRAPTVRPDLVRRPIEQEVLRYFEDPAELFSVMKHPAVLAVAADEYEFELRYHNLVPDEPTQEMRRALIRLAIGALIAVGAVKLVVAFGADRTNVLFLVAMVVVAPIALAKLSSPYRTAIGDAYLESIRSMFSGLRDRVSSIRPGAGSRDLLWLTSLFGAAALPASSFPFVQYFKRKTTSGSGCGSSCGGGGDGGCGGGGGCGGCGG